MMKHLLLSFILLTLSSCASKERLKLAQEWMGRPQGELEQHPFFSKLKSRQIEDGRIYTEPFEFRSRASCQALGGCMGLSNGHCENIFTIKEGRIEAYEMKGSCLLDKRKAPLTSN